MLTDVRLTNRCGILKRVHQKKPKQSVRQSSFSLIDRSVRSVRFVNILIDAKCLVSNKCLPTEKRLVSTKCLLTTKSLPSAKSLPTTKSLAFTKFLVVDKHLKVENLSNMTEMSSSNNVWSMKINYSQIVIFVIFFHDQMKSNLVSES